MPDGYSNFTQKDSGSSTGGAAEWFDPVTRTWKTGVPPAGAHTRQGAPAKADPRQWGGYGRAKDASGREIAGTSAGERDVERYRDMAKPGATTPIIDQTRSNETRGYQDRSLGYLGRAATGEESLARKVGAEQTVAAVNAGRSLAAGVRGGPMARAAAMRTAGQNQGSLEARARTATDAAAAAEQAGARGAYFSAATGQRGQDLGVATSQAGLELGQRSADDQREGFYEGLGWDTANAQLESGLGVSRSDQAAGAAARASASAAADQRQKSQQDLITTVAGGATGLMQGAQAQANPDPTKPPPKIYSDERTKKAAPVKKYVSSREQQGPSELERAIGDIVKRDREPTYGYLDEIASPARHGESMLGYIERETEGARPYDVPSTTPEPLRMSKAEPGYAASRAGQPGYMFGGGGEDGPPKSAARQARDAEVMMSDDRAKLAKAWDEGHAAAVADVQKLAKLPASQLKSREEPAAAVLKEAKAGGWDEGNQAATMAANKRRIEGDFDPAAQDARVAAPPPSPPTPEPQAGPGYLAQVMGRARAMVSDEEAKHSKGYVPGVMADANRSMRPSVYEYKPEYAGRSGQKVGEKNVGPMANPMAEDPVASTAIERQPDGMLAIDKDKGLKLVMGGLADLQMQVDRMKKKGAA